MFLNDVLVDFSRPVSVICNGVELGVVIPRQLSSFMNLLHDGTRDAAAVYVARAEYDMSGVAPVAESEAPSGSEAEFERRLFAAGSDVAELRELHLWCASAPLPRQDAQAAEERGLVEFKSLWMHRDERALAVKGWVKDQETGL